MGSRTVDVIAVSAASRVIGVSADVSVESGTIEEGTSEELGISAKKSGTKAIDESIKIGA